MRRHFILAQTKILKGDKNWVENQVYEVNETLVPLFRPAPKWEKEEDLKNTRLDFIPSISRLQRIFIEAGKSC